MDGSFAKGLGTAVLTVMIIAVFAVALPTFLITKKIYYKRGYKCGAMDVYTKKIKIDFKKDSTLIIK